MFELLLFLIGIIFILCALFGYIRFFLDTRKYSSYFNELKNLREKAEKQLNINLEEQETKEDTIND